MKKLFILIAAIGFTWTHVNAQQGVTLEEAIALGKKNHPSLKGAALRTAAAQAQKKTSVDLPKTEIALMYGQYNSHVSNDNNVTITQAIPFPTTFIAQRNLFKEQIKSSKINERIAAQELQRDIRQTFNTILFLKSRGRLLQEHDSLIQEVLRISQVLYKTGEVSSLAVSTAELQAMETKTAYEQNTTDLTTALQKLSALTQSPITDISGTLENESLPPTTLTDYSNNPYLLYSKQQERVSLMEKRVQLNRALPDLTVGYFNQTLTGIQNVNGEETYFGPGQRFDGFIIGVAIPLWFLNQQGNIQRASRTQAAVEQERQALELSLGQNMNEHRKAYEKNLRLLDYYRDGALKNAQEVLSKTQRAFQAGELEYQTVLLNMTQALRIREGYLMALYKRNESLITIDYLTGQ